jgi:SAM-dependent methyltransferase
MHPSKHNFREHYETGNVPWDSGVVEPELVRVIDAGLLPGKTLLELGCGTGTNAIELARRGYQVTAVDYVPLAIDAAKKKAADAGVTSIDFRIADILSDDLGGPYDVLFDRGVYHSLRDDGLTIFQSVLRKVTRPGTRWLCLCGNANEKNEGMGPPRVTEQQIRGELGGIFDILDLHAIRLTSSRSGMHPLFWSVLMERKR